MRDCRQNFAENQADTYLYNRLYTVMETHKHLNKRSKTFILDILKHKVDEGEL